MKVFLIILAVIVLLFIIILSISAEFTIIFDNGWTTKVKVLFFEMDVRLTKLLSFIVAPEKAGEEAAEESKKKKEKKKAEKKEKKEKADEGQADNSSDKGDIQSAERDNSKDKTEEKQVTLEETEVSDEASDKKKQKKDKNAEKPAKKNPVQKILDEDGVVGLLLLVSNLFQTVNTAVITLIKGLHIYSLYVKMIIGGGDAASIAEKYGGICSWYYPLKGLILTQMKVDLYDDYIEPDFIAPRSEYEFQLIGSLSVGLLVKVLLKAGVKFVVTYIRNK